MVSQYTRTGARRSGDDYQDIIALQVIVEMLEHPDRYQWLKVEADDSGALDDVVALRTDNTYVLKQVKFSVDPEGDALDWEYLLYQKEGKGKPGKKGKLLPSLLQKWFSALEHISTDRSLHEASLVTNRVASTQIKASLSIEGILDFNQITDPKIKERIIEQIGDESKARVFFSDFRFYVDRPGIANYEAAVQKRFYLLGGRPEGWLKLKDALRSWVRIRNEPPPEGKITLEHIKKAALWNELRQMPQNFEVPLDYVVPNYDFYEHFKSKVISGGQNCLVLYASPGVGKSTFLSYLCADLKKNNIPVIRHHYFLSLRDRPERFDYENIAKSLMYEIMHEHQEALGNLAATNPDPSDLYGWLKACGDFFANQKKGLIIVIDGLDHVWREQSSIEKLNRLFENLFPIPEGIVIVVGTQPVDDRFLPSKLIQHVQRKKWYELPFLDKSATRTWLRLHRNDLILPREYHARKNILDNLSTAFYDKSNGHPLHLKYTLRALIESNVVVTEQNVRSLPSCPHSDIVSYYNRLWGTLTEQSRLILHLFAVANFPWPRSGIFDCIDPGGNNLAEISSGLKQIRHLLSYGYLGLQPFHSSLLEFVKNTEDHRSYVRRLRQMILAWLQNKAPEYWKWAWEWRLQIELGDQDAIINGINRNWCIDNISKRYPFIDANQLFALGIKAVLGSNNIVEFVRIDLLRDYYNTVYSYRDEVLKELLLSQLITKEDASLETRLFDNIAALSHDEIVILAEYENRQCNNDIIKKCFDELNGRLKRPHDEHQIMNRDWERIVGSTIKTAAIATQEISVDRFYSYIRANRKKGRSTAICELYARELWLSNSATALRRLLQKDLLESEYQVVIKYATLLGFAEQVDFADEVISYRSSASPFAAIYRVLKMKDRFSFEINRSLPDIFRLKEHEQYDSRDLITSHFYNIFFMLFANHILNNATPNVTFINQINACEWVHEFLLKCNDICSRLSGLLLEGTQIEYAWLYDQLNDFKRPNWPDDRDINQYGFAAEKALYQISFDLLIITGHNRITESDVLRFCNSQYCHLWSWVDAYIDQQKCFMDESCVKWFLERQQKEIELNIDEFNKRASQYAKLATMAGRHGIFETAQFCIFKAASNLLTHGEHKDIILFHMLDIIKACHENGIAKAKEWLYRIIPIIAAVERFTDGDETSHLPVRLAETFAVVSPEYLPKYYIWLSKEEEYHDALRVFHIYLRTANLSNTTNQAIAKTAIDNESIEILHQRSNDGDKNARIILDELRKVLGGIVVADAENAIENKEVSNANLNNSFPDPGAYPPENLAAYITQSNASNPYERGHCLSHWMNYWSCTEKKESAFQAMVQEETRMGRLGLENYPKMYEVALSLYGKREAYAWLVKAHISRGGWSANWTKEEEAVNRWEIVKRDYSEKWLDFLKDTMKSIYGNELEYSIHDRILRIVKYCIFMEKKELAESIAEQLLESILELVSPGSFTAPEWIET